MGLSVYHIVWVTKNSKVSERMINFNVSKGEAVILSNKDEIEILEYIIDISREINLKLYAVNICINHVHILVQIDKNEKADIAKLVRKLKSKSTFLYKKNHNIKETVNLWGQKFYSGVIETKDLENTLKYIKNNRVKHNLDKNIELDNLLDKEIYLVS